MFRASTLLFCLVVLLSLASFNSAADEADSDEDGWINYFEEACGTDPLDSESIPTDSDSSGICDELDIDDDNDGWIDSVENICGTDSLNSESIPNDLDNDGICDSLDKDTDNDTWSDFDELLCKTSPINNKSYPLDINEDGKMTNASAFHYKPPLASSIPPELDIDLIPSFILCIFSPTYINSCANRSTLKEVILVSSNP